MFAESLCFFLFALLAPRPPIQFKRRTVDNRAVLGGGMPVNVNSNHSRTPTPKHTHGYPLK